MPWIQTVPNAAGASRREVGGWRQTHDGGLAATGDVTVVVK
jgi:hypothetical protein